jgi:hypothetical protein
MNPSLSKSEINRQRWRERVNAWKDSGQSQKEFCKAHHLGFATFRRWRGIFKAENAEGVVATAEPVRFLPVSVHEPPYTNLTIHIQDDLRIELAPGFDPQLLRQVLQVLRTS